MEKLLSSCALLWIFLVLCQNAFCSHSLRHHGTHHVTDDAEEDDPEDRSSSGEEPETHPAAAAPQPQPPAKPSPPEHQKETVPEASEAVTAEDEETSAEDTSTPPPLPEVVVRPGNELVLNCELGNATTGPVLWLQNGKSVRVDGSRRYLIAEGHLKITRVAPDDGGIWQCQERTRDAITTSKPVWVVVMATPSQVFVQYEGRRLAKEARLTSREKGGLVISCVVDGGNPPPRVEWFVMGMANVTNSSQTLSDYAKQESVYYTKSELRLDNLTRDHHNKSVQCVVHHVSWDGPRNASVRLNVEYSPSFIISRIPGFGYPIREGIALALKCDVDANPPSTPFWLKDEAEPAMPQSDDGFLNFTQLRRADSGWYKCSTQHSLGNFSSIGYYLNVRYEAEITAQPPRQVRVELGGAVRLRCDAVGLPAPALCWGRLGEGGRLEAVGAGRDLSLERVLYQEAGTYRCVARNRLGLDERRAETHNVDVVVTGRPVVYPVNKTLVAMAGKPSSLSVEFCANPPPRQAIWIVKSILLRPGEVVDRFIAHNLTAAESPDCHFAVLTILDLQADDAGEYMFLVKNSKGIDEGTVVLNITQASFSISQAPICTGTLIWLAVQILVSIVYRFCMKSVYAL